MNYFMDGVSQIVTAKRAGTLFFTVLDMKYAYSQIKLTAETAKQHCGWPSNRNIQFPSGFYGLADMPAEFQKAIDRTLNHAKNTFCFLDDVLIVSKGDKKEHEKLVLEVLKKIDDENRALKLSKCEFFQT